MIELLVVIIIIGILAAIAIPVFLNQRKKGWDAAAESDLRNAATAEETYVTESGHYSDSSVDLTANGYRPSANVTSLTVSVMYTADGAVTTVPAQADGGYCLQAVSASGTTFRLRSDEGRPVARGVC